MSRIVNIFLFSCLFFTVGCRKGLDRTPIKLSRKNVPTLGISIEIPEKSERLDIADSDEYLKEYHIKDLFFSLHPVYPGGINEPFYLIRFNLITFTKENYELFTAEKLYSQGRPFKNKSFMEQITEFTVMFGDGRTPLKCYRKDYKNEKTGEVVLFSATYLDNFSENIEYREKDIEIIKKILNSLEFLPSPKIEKK